MELITAAKQLAALSEPSRLQVYRYLVQAAPDGLCVSEVLAKMDLSQPAISFHLKELANAGLVSRRKVGRHIFYAPQFDAMHSLMGYLMENCCEGQACMQTLTDCQPTRVNCSAESRV